MKVAILLDNSISIIRFILKINYCFLKLLINRDYIKNNKVFKILHL